MGTAIVGPPIMRLVNTPPLHASLAVAARHDGGRDVAVFAKATFTFAEIGGHAWLDTGSIELLRTADETTRAGTFPRDDQLPDDGRFEVFCYGDAVATAPTSQLDVALSVDGERRTLRVFGERAWSHAGRDATPSVATKFERMAIAPSTTFGGSHRVEVDAGAIVPFIDDRNPAGKGIVVDEAARNLSEHLGAASGYPKLPATWPLANVEHPAERVTHPAMRPRAAHWGAHPLDYKPAGKTPYSVTHRPVVDLGRAHPDWQLGQRVTMPRRIGLEHLSADSPELTVLLPEGEVTADVLSGGTTRSISLWPRRLFVMPNERRVALLFATTLIVDRPRNDDRAIRLRWTPGGTP